MKTFGMDADFLKGECGFCGKVLKIPIQYAVCDTNGYKLNPPVKCACGQTHNYSHGIKTVVDYSRLGSKSLLINCQACNKPISGDSTACIHCGHPMKQPIGFWGIVGAIIIAILIMSFL